MCGGDIETTLRENAVFFLVGDLCDLAACSLPEVKGPVLFAILPVKP